MALRQTTGFVESLLHLIDLDWAVPDFSTLSRRQKTLKVNIAYCGSQGPLHLLIDSTGIKVEGEGAWPFAGKTIPRIVFWPGSYASMAAPNGALAIVLGPMADTGSRRKIHIGIDAQTLEIRAAEFTTSDVGDVEPVNATGSSEPARDAARASRPDPA